MKQIAEASCRYFQDNVSIPDAGSRAGLAKKVTVECEVNNANVFVLFRIPKQWVYRRKIYNLCMILFLKRANG
jgi:hypothetical protein